MTRRRKRRTGSQVSMAPHVATALRIAALEAGAKSVNELLLNAANAQKDEVQALLARWPEDWAAGPRCSRVVISHDMCDYLLQLAPPRTQKGRRTPLDGIPVLIARLEAMPAK